MLLRTLLVLFLTISACSHKPPLPPESYPCTPIMVTERLPNGDVDWGRTLEASYFFCVSTVDKNKFKRVPFLEYILDKPVAVTKFEYKALLDYIEVLKKWGKNNCSADNN